ncbi:transcription factor HES-5-like [Conger conger]|uniref:transcription factor HES-5-like n=1 Tax=Conger conger TaxID=82655 RepID=UPI002A59910C|nr:transcription factor HES-5-like [Conger conger]
MAPCSFSTDYSSLKMSHKLRKPVVEKMRRDRINSSIEQLKALLETQVRRSDPSARLEKADVLEMTVGFLQTQLQPRAAAGQQGFSQGYSQCWREALHYLSARSPQQHRLQGAPASAQKQRPETPACSKPRPAAARQSTGADLPVWRPW